MCPYITRGHSTYSRDVFWSQAAGNISTDAAQTKERAIQLNDEARQLSSDVDGATLNLEKYEQQADEDAQLVREVRVALSTRGIS